MDMPFKREIVTAEIVIETGDYGIDSKQYSRNYIEVLSMMKADGVRLKL